MTIKQIQIILIVCTIIIVIISCKKEIKPYTISGFFFGGCPKQSLANQQIKLMYKKSSGMYYFNETSQIVTTDINGYFTFTTNLKSWWIQVSGSEDVLYSSNSKTNVSNIEIYKGVSNAIRVYLNVIRPYTINDTLLLYHVRDSNGFSYRITGPFNSGFLLTTPNFTPNIAFYSNQDLDSIKIASIETAISNNWGKHTYSKFNFSLCDTSTVTINID